VDIRILENLLAVVIDEAVGERVNVGQRCQQNKYEEDGGIAITVAFSARPIFRHKTMVAEGNGGI
jgi:hypothetical protein